MSVLDMLEKKLNSLNIFEGNMPEIVKAVANSIPNQSIPYRMKLAIAVSEIILFCSQFRRNIKHWNDSIIPINSIMFCIAKSGAYKDSSVKAVRKCFEEGYKIINECRQENAIERAIECAKEAGYEMPEIFASYKDFYIQPNPLFVAISTTEGFIQHLNDLSNDTIGAGFIYSGEIGAELASNTNLVENIKVLSELYDEGSKEVKILKARENQSREVKNLPVSALFIGSQDNLLFDDIIKRKFKTEFTTKLSRRSFFIFINEDVINSSFESISDLINKERIIEDQSKNSRKEVSDYIVELTNYLIQNESENVIVSEKARDLFSLYRRYNEEIASTIDNQFPMTKLTRNHLQWKALKLSGALALIDGRLEILENDYKAAIEFVELVYKDIYNFEKELVKEPYELFTDYVRVYSIDNEFSIGLHELRKAGFIPMKGQSATSLKELVKLCNSYDRNGIYELKNDTIYFKQLDKTESILVSYLHCTGTKSQRRSKCSEGFICEEVVFKNIESMLEGDFAYCPFRFKNGIRGKDNIDSTCKWIVLDIDSSEITDKEAHILLSDINHYVVRTSNPNNPNKFRVLIELDAEIDIPDIKWNHFINIVVKDLGLIADPLPKAQIYFSYSNREILSQLDGSPLEVKPYLDELANIPQKETKPLSKKESNHLLDDPLSTFEPAFNARSGEGGRKLIWAARRARELGADKEYTLDLMNKINNYWTISYPEPDFTRCILDQINRWSF